MYVIFPSCTHWTASSMRPVSCFSTVSSNLLLSSLRQERISAPNRKSALPVQPCGTERTKNTWETWGLLSSRCVPRPAPATLLSLSRSLNIQDEQTGPKTKGWENRTCSWPGGVGIPMGPPGKEAALFSPPGCHCHVLWPTSSLPTKLQTRLISRLVWRLTFISPPRTFLPPAGAHSFAGMCVFALLQVWWLVDSNYLYCCCTAASELSIAFVQRSPAQMILQPDYNDLFHFALYTNATVIFTKSASE